MAIGKARQGDGLLGVREFAGAEVAERGAGVLRSLGELLFGGGGLHGFGCGLVSGLVAAGVDLLESGRVGGNSSFGRGSLGVQA